jgi:hypothetical protein
VKRGVNQPLKCEKNSAKPFASQSQVVYNRCGSDIYIIFQVTNQSLFYVIANSTKDFKIERISVLKGGGAKNLAKYLAPL